MYVTFHVDQIGSGNHNTNKRLVKIASHTQTIEPSDTTMIVQAIGMITRHGRKSQPAFVDRFRSIA